MEGPSLLLASEQLQPLLHHKVKKVSGNTKIDKERLLKKEVLSIFSHGKYLYFQFDTFALRVHFMLFGSFEATINKTKVTGDYPRRERPIRLGLEFKIGEVLMYNCSLRFIEEANAIEKCDFSIDTLSRDWDEKKAYKKLLEEPPSLEIGDVLLDQTIFMGVGNIIKNEVLYLCKVLPTTKLSELSPYKLKKIIRSIRTYVFQFYEWRKKFELRKNYKVYRQKVCKSCEGPVIRKKTGLRDRMSYFCEKCQK
ncbi:hypothetical protein [Criblamydia sequanensis]|uniref:Formamidopyrimidine-DNA glycosylase n=1 Tax=Candidatus Criblamydia sequanensis CRIB-18 TaxID=1437425 RepID=A0A090D339_9BACT|nr:hypothetical protein [Criblamydia sequanensis]CDR35170.1 Putative formamidopyrimidine-DNA glycosylase [Criblamydia sequanensis CRIB-18]